MKYLKEALQLAKELQADALLRRDTYAQMSEHAKQLAEREQKVLIQMEAATQLASRATLQSEEATHLARQARLQME